MSSQACDDPRATSVAGGKSVEPTNAFSTAALAAALPDNDGNAVKDAAQSTDAPNGADDKHPAAVGWVDAKAYDYAEFDRNDGQWEGDARVYEWDGEEGDVGPEYPELEIELFGHPDSRESHGIDFSKIMEIQLYQEGPARVAPIASFESAGLHPAMLRNVELAGYKVPTPIQRYCIPAINSGHDVIAVAQTGSGKTAAYLVPILNKLMGKAKKLAAPRPNPATYVSGLHPPVRAEPLVVVVCPNRELAVQIFYEARKFCYRTMLRPCVVYGGGPLKLQIDQLQKGCDVLISSPGRLIDIMDRPHVLTLRRVRYMVIDEADEMLHADWEEEFNKILAGGEQEEGNVKYMLFSATFPKAARDLAKSHLAETHVRLRVGRAGSTHENIKQTIIYVSPQQKREALLDLMQSLPPTRTIIFVNTKRAADELDDFLYNKGLPCVSIHSDRTQREREAAMRAFRRGDMPILIATGVSSRGIDVRNVMHVVNYDLPSIEHGGIEEYTHRIGRTGRIGHRGLASSFYNERDEPLASVLTRTLLETNQEVPDFLQSHIPEGEARENLKFEADSDYDAAEFDATSGGGDGWGSTDEPEQVSGGGGWGPANDTDTGAHADQSVSADNWGGNNTQPNAAAESSW